MTVKEKLIQSLLVIVGSSISDLLWYGLLACSVWFFFYVSFQSQFRHRRISQDDPRPGQVRRELLCSLRSIAIFGLVTGGVVYAAYSGWSRIYVRVDQYGWGWFAASIGLMIVLHDAYFYWTHRLMHHPRLYRVFGHDTHHRSTSPTPWAAYAFSPAEALVQAGIGPLVVFTFPVHPVAFGLFMGWQVAFNVFGHGGFEIFPKWFLPSPASRVLNSVTHHALHHEKYKSNFGLYFNVWDRLMGTNHQDYERRFDLATGPPPKLPESSPTAKHA